MIDRKFKSTLKISRQMWLIFFLSLLLLLIVWVLPQPVGATPAYLPRVASQCLGGYALWTDNPTPEKTIKCPDNNSDDQDPQVPPR